MPRTDLGCWLGSTRPAPLSSFPNAIAACEQLIAVGQDPTGPGLGMLARRIAQDTEPSTPEVDLSVYDLLPARRQTHHRNDQNAQVGA